MTRKELALDMHARTYNCAQCVFCAYCDLIGLDEKTGFRLAEAFGGGCAHLQETCGALTGLCALAGYLCSDGVIGDRKTKSAAWKDVRKYADRFIAEAGNSSCLTLNGGVRIDTPEWKTRPKGFCNRLIAIACDIAEDMFREKGIEPGTKD